MKDLPSQRARFGPFELNLRSGELCQGDRRIPLQEQPFRVLQLILEHGLELTTREQIRKALWPNDTVVEFDHGINTAIKKIRQALGDSAENPVYIETVARRGYRCMVSVEWPTGLGIALLSDSPNDSLKSPGAELRDQGPDVDRAALLFESTGGSGGLAGKRFSHYRVLEILGGGGMGVVYKALDLKLDRAVALKFLPEEMGEDEKAVARFEREARAVSALDHPNICPIYEFGEHEGRPFIVMPLLEGRNLRDILAGSENDPGCSFPIQQLLEVSVQIASGLEAAHDKGIIHRDIKPANIFITQRGFAKILDFGIAKMLPTGESGEVEVEDDPGCGHGTSSTATAQTLSLTRTGIAVGSAGYMSPEQVRGDKLDARTDLYSFGLVVYEMASGQRPFPGASIPDFPPSNVLPRPLPESIPSRLSEIILSCLEQSPGKRYQSATELLAALESLQILPALPDKTKGQASLRKKNRSSEKFTELALVISAAFRQKKTLWGVAAVIVSLFAAVIFWHFVPGKVARVTGSTQLTYDSDPSWFVVTDGVRLYFRQNRTGDVQLAQMSVAGGDVSSLPVAISHPAIADISPDHSNLLITTSDSENAPLWILPLPAGSPRKLGGMEVNGASWAPQGKHLLLTRDHDIYLAAPDGSSPRRLVSLSQGTAQCAGFSPDGSRIRFGIINRRVATTTLWEIRADGSDLHQLLQGWSGALDCGGSWTPDGRYFVFGSEAVDGSHNIFALPESRSPFFKAPGTPVQLTFGPLKYEAPVVSSDGKKLFVFGWNRRGELVRYDAASEHFIPFLGGISAEGVSFSNDGKWIAYNTIPGYDLWRSRADGSEKMQLTRSVAETIFLTPHWSPDGKQIAVVSETAGNPSKIFLISADGGPPRPLLQEMTPQLDPAWSPDGTQMAFGSEEGYGPEKYVIKIVDIRTRQVSTVPGSSGMFSPRWSPNGRYLAALSSEFRPKKVFLYDFHTRRWSDWLIDQDVGHPTWSADSQYLQYVEYNSGDRDARVRRVKVGDSRPEDLYRLGGVRRFDGIGGPWSDTAPDGSRMFLRDISGRDIYALDVTFP